MTEPRAPLIVGPDGRPLPRAKKDNGRCPRCGAGRDKRVASSGFGIPHPVCCLCGYEWRDEVFHGE